MDSKLLIGPVFPTPDPTSRTPWNITSISPRRPMELSSMATTVSIALQLLISPFLFKWLSLDCTGEPLRVAWMRKGGENVNQPTQMGKNGQRNSLFFSFRKREMFESESARGVTSLWMNESRHPPHACVSALCSFSAGPEWKQERSANPVITGGSLACSAEAVKRCCGCSYV